MNLTKQNRFLTFCLSLTCAIMLFLSTPLLAIDKDAIEDLFAKGFTVDLRNPVYSSGVLSTQEGGVVNGPDMRIQAKNITYTRKTVDGELIYTIEAEGQLLLEYGHYVLVGSRLQYDFQNRTGTLYNGRSALEPWHFGGDIIELLPEGDILIINGFITTSEQQPPEWQIHSSQIKVTQDHILTARNLKFRVLDATFLWLPILKTNLDWIGDSPIRYRIRWGGEQGLRVGMIYEFFSMKNFKTFLRFDYRLNRGPAGGIETRYVSEDKSESFSSISYLARDSSIEDPSERTRYRFEGIYFKSLDDGKQVIDFSYDKLSDKEMATDYYDRGLDLKTAGRTQINLRRQYNETSIVNFFSRVRVNSFQTIKQELPSITGYLHPLALGNSGIILDNYAKVSYLDFRYAHDQPEKIYDFHSSRLEYSPKIYRTFSLGPSLFTPEAKMISIFYGDSPQHDSKWLLTGSFAAEIKTNLYRHYNCYKHVFEPYSRYEYIIFPDVTPSERYIFDISDGWYRLNALRLGTRNLIYSKNGEGIVSRYLCADLFTYAFIDTPTWKQSIPRLYSLITWDLFPYLRYTLDTAWDFEHGLLDHFNIRSEWTVSEDLALSTEYRQRSAFSWRKCDPYNFMMESFRSENELSKSQLSDRRDTFLWHIYYRFHPDLIFEGEVRHGWHRKLEPKYFEYQWDLLVNLPASWNLRISYQHKEDDHRFAFYFSLGTAKPK